MQQERLRAPCVRRIRRLPKQARQFRLVGANLDIREPIRIVSSVSLASSRALWARLHAAAVLPAHTVMTPASRPVLIAPLVHLRPTTKVRVWLIADAMPATPAQMGLNALHAAMENSNQKRVLRAAQTVKQESLPRVVDQQFAFHVLPEHTQTAMGRPGNLPASAPLATRSWATIDAIHVLLESSRRAWG